MKLKENKMNKEYVFVDSLKPKGFFQRLKLKFKIKTLTDNQVLIERPTNEQLGLLTEKQIYIKANEVEAFLVHGRQIMLALKDCPRTELFFDQIDKKNSDEIFLDIDYLIEDKLVFFDGFHYYLSINGFVIASKLQSKTTIIQQIKG